VRSIAEKYSMTPGVGIVVYDPATLITTSLASTAIGTGLSAATTILGGNAAAKAGRYTAAQLNQNAAAARAAGQRRMFDTQLRSRFLQSTATARAAGSGVNAGIGSPAADVGQIARRGSYQAAMDLWTGENTATGLENEAAGAIYTGNVQQASSWLSAAGTIAGGAGSILAQGARFAYPQPPPTYINMGMDQTGLGRESWRDIPPPPRYGFGYGY